LALNVSHCRRVAPEYNPCLVVVSYSSTDYPCPAYLSMMQVRGHWTLSPHVGADPYDGGLSYMPVSDSVRCN